MTQYLIAFGILFTFGLQFYIPTDILWRKVSNKIKEKHHNIAQIGMRLVLVLLMSGVCMAIPDLEPFIGLVGAVFLSLLGATIYFISNLQANLCFFQRSIISNRH